MGMMRGGMEFGEAIQRYGLLTMGDGLCSQIPSLLISLATGILVTKASKEADFSNILVHHSSGNRKRNAKRYKQKPFKRRKDT